MAGQGKDNAAVKVLGAWPSPFVMRARIALNLKKVGYELVEECIFDKSELLLKSNPVYKKIPVLLHGDRAICESLIIVEYIDGVWSDGPSILPSDPYDRYLARFWATVVDDKLFPAIMGMAKAKTQEEAGAAVERIAAALPLLEEAFQKCSKGRDFFGGDTIGYLDMALGCYLGFMRAIEKMTAATLLDEAKLPHLARWVRRFCADPAVKVVMPETDNMVEFFKTFKAKLEAMPPPTN
jgi:glutathione S-transferase